MRIIFICLFFYGLISCKENPKSYVSCKEQCDSIFYDPDSRALYRYWKGDVTGEFLVFKNGDTIYGYAENLGGIVKKTYRFSDIHTNVVFEYWNGAKNELSEIVIFRNNKLDTAYYCYFEFEERNDTGIFIPQIIDDVDSIILSNSSSIPFHYRNKSLRVPNWRNYNFKKVDLTVLSKIPNTNSFRADIIRLSNQRIVDDIDPYPIKLIE